MEFDAVSQEKLWAPWRMSYVSSPTTPDDDGCFLCRYIASGNDEKNLVVGRGDHSITVLNRFPYNNGHLLIAPLSHKGSLEELDDAELFDGLLEVKKMTTVLKKLLKADGFNVGLNLGKAAGAGLPGHLHWHIVPRWDGDTNFMPVLGDAKVISQSLEALYDLLKAEI